MRKFMRNGDVCLDYSGPVPGNFMDAIGVGADAQCWPLVRRASVRGWKLRSMSAFERVVFEESSITTINARNTFASDCVFREVVFTGKISRLNARQMSLNKAGDVVVPPEVYDLDLARFAFSIDVSSAHLDRCEVMLLCSPVTIVHDFPRQIVVVGSRCAEYARRSNRGCLSSRAMEVFVNSSVLWNERCRSPVWVLDSTDKQWGSLDDAQGDFRELQDAGVVWLPHLA